MEAQCAYRAMRGDIRAFEKLITLHEVRMYRMAYLYVKNRDDALDVVQNAACRAFRSIRGMKNPEHVTTWLIRITINCAVDMLRRQGREMTCPPDFIENVGPVSEDEGKGVIERITLEQLIDELDAPEKQAVMLRYYCGYTFNEIAGEMSVPLGTAKTLLYRALGKLKKKAKENGHDD